MKLSAPLILINTQKIIQRKLVKKVINGEMISRLKEILNMVKVNKLTIKFAIKLETGRIIDFKIEFIILKCVI